MKKFSNLIGGEEYSLSGRTFIARSPFFDYQVLVDDASKLDIDIASNYSKNASEKLRELGYLRRKEILHKTARSLTFDNEDIEHCVKMMGMPKRYIGVYIGEVPQLLSGYSNKLEERVQLVNGQISRIYTDIGFLEMKEPLDGFVYSIVPSNDPRAMSFVFSVIGTLGLPALLKISKNELPIAHKIAKTAIENGYPAESLNLLCWDTEDHERAKMLHFYILNNHDPSFFIPFGNDQTVDEELRYEERKIIRPENLSRYFGKTLDEKTLDELIEVERIDRLKGNVFRHTSGNCSVIVDGFSEKAVELTGYSAFEYPISCKSAKSVYFVGNQRDFDTFKRALADYARKLFVGDPLNEKTQVGYVDTKILDHVFNKLDELRTLGQIEIVYGGDRINKFQATPLILATDDHESPFLTKENSMYILTLKRVNSLEQAVDQCNIPGFKERLAVSIITDREDIELASAVANLRCDQCHKNEITRFLHPPAHQGVMYFERMSKTKSIYLGESLKKIPFETGEIKKEYGVLFIDDERQIAHNIIEEIKLECDGDKEFNKRNKLKTLVAYSGEEGIETARRNPNIDIIVTDMRMPGISGAITIHRIKEIIPNIVPIVVSAYTDRHDRDEARLAGAVDYIIKPYDSRDLWSAIKTRLLKSQ